MATRNSGYARVNGDTYVTPSGPYLSLYSAEPGFINAFDPAPAIRPVGLDGLKYDFLKDQSIHAALATNPPFSLSDAFVRHAIDRTRPLFGKVAMLLPHTWDTAKKRVELFKVPYKGKYVLTKRIRWANLEQKKNGPSTNCAWYIWDWKYTGKQPVMGWL